VVAVLALGGGCSSKKANGSADPTVPTAPTETTATAAPDPFAVPEVIDEAYVNRVLAALYRVDGDALRRVVASGMVDAESRKILRAVYNDPQFELEFDGLTKTFAKGLERYKTPPGDRRTTVTKLRTAQPDCIFVETEVDFSEVVKSPPAWVDDVFRVLALERTQQETDPQNLNPTPWSISYTEVVKDGESPQEQPCTE